MIGTRRVAPCLQTSQTSAAPSKQLELELLRIQEQMMALQRRMFAASSEKRPRQAVQEAAEVIPAGARQALDLE